MPSAWWGRIGPALVDALLSPFPPVRRRAVCWGTGSGLTGSPVFGLASARAYGECEFAGDAARQLLAGSALHARPAAGSAGGAVFAWMLTGRGRQVGWPRVVGGEIWCDRRAEEVVVRGGRARGVRVADGTEIAAAAPSWPIGAPALYRRLLRGSLPAGPGLRWFRYDHATKARRAASPTPHARP